MELSTAYAITSLAQLARGGKWRLEALRSHSRPRLLWISNGQGRITLAGQTRGFTPNNLIFIPGNTLYGIQQLSPLTGTQLALPARSGDEWPEAPVHLRVLENHPQMEIAARLDAIERELTADRPAAERAVGHHAGLLAVFLERRLAEAEGDAGLPDTSTTRIAAAFTDLVARDFALGRTIADYARELGVTSTHLSRCCRAATGRAAHALLADRRLYEARKRLTDTAEPINRIAGDLGFGSPAYFTRVFHAHTGRSPSDFRRDAL
ncbi:helix-turn-helix domain-containing protein [Aestuariibius sp. 2305UL40-4]|uniref:helix-turn-helix domain-containing protein n=1 Tax=Aestuariibius violaceus TaxID=3234132 RepID=UPI00345EC93D